MADHGGDYFLMPADVAALIARGLRLMAVDPTRWPRAIYQERITPSMRHAVQRWLARERR